MNRVSTSLLLSFWQLLTPEQKTIENNRIEGKELVTRTEKTNRNNS